MKQRGHATSKPFGLLRAKGGFATILVLLVVVLVGGVGVGWYLSNQGIIPKFSGPLYPEQPPALPAVPEDDETANWKTYINNSYKYTFKYPDTWSISGREESQVLYNTSGGASNDESGLGYQVAIGSTTYLEKGVRVEDPIGTKKEIADLVFEEKIEDLTIANRPAAKFRIRVSPGSATEPIPANVTVKVKYNNSYVVYIQLTSLDEEDTKVFYQILSTFRFE